MSLISLTMTVLAIAIIVGAVLLIKKTAKKFNLSEEQLNKIKKREQEQEDKDKQQDKS